MLTAVVILADGFEEIEAVTPVDLLRRSGVRVVVAGLSGLTAASTRGLKVVCDTTLDRVEPGWDMLVLPGGLPGARHLGESPLVRQLVEEAFARRVWVAAICAAPAQVLGRHGWLDGLTFTGYPGTEADVPLGIYRVDPVVVDANVVTSRGVGTAGDFALCLVRLLAGPEKAASVARDVLLA